MRKNCPCLRRQGSENMADYVIALNRKASISIDQFVEAVKRVAETDVPDEIMQRVIVKYSGTIDQLREDLGYNPQDVHIEKIIEHHKNT